MSSELFECLISVNIYVCIGSSSCVFTEYQSQFLGRFFSFLQYSVVDNLLKCLDCLDSHEDSSTSSTKDQIQTLKADLRLLRTFLMCSACRHIEDSNAKHALMYVQKLWCEMQNQIFNLSTLKKYRVVFLQSILSTHFLAHSIVFSAISP